MSDNNRQILLFDEIKKNKASYVILKEFLEYKYTDLVGVVINTDDNAQDLVMKGKARAYKEVIDLLS